MKHTFLAAGLGLLALLSSCGKNNSDTPAPTTQGRYLVMSNDFLSPTGAGYLNTYADLPSGTVSNVGTSSLQSLGTFALGQYNNWVFKSSNAANESGIQKYSVGTDGKLKDEGFIKAAAYSRYYIVSATEGYYADDDLGKLKIQKFNPTTMQRTGTLDLTANLAQAGTAYATAGQHVIAAGNGKLFVDVYYSDNAQSIGFLDYKYSTAYMAVIDLATGRYEKTIGMPNITGGIGFLSPNPMWTKAANGDMYFCCLGNIGGAVSKIVRIKNGATDFDQTWSLSMADYRAGSTFCDLYVKDNTLYTSISTQAVKSDFSNLYDEMWEYHAIDLTTKQAVKVPGVGTPVLFSGNSHSIVEANGKLYLRVINTPKSLNGYYVLDGGTAKPAFNLSAGGNAQDFLFIPR